MEENISKNVEKKVEKKRELYSQEIKTQALKLYLSGKKHGEIAQALDVPENTLGTWSQADKWKETKDNLKHQLTDNAIAEIVKGGTDSLVTIASKTPAAIDSLYSILSNQAETPGNKLKAAQGIKTLVETLKLCNPTDQGAAGKLSGRL